MLTNFVYLYSQINKIINVQSIKKFRILFIFLNADVGP